MSYSTNHDDNLLTNEVIIRVDGDLRNGGGAQLHKAVESLTTSPDIPARLTLDLKNLQTVDEAGWEIMQSALNRLVNCAVRVNFQHASAQFRERIERVALGELLDDRGPVDDSSQSGPAERNTIFVVDDEEMILGFTSLFLQREGYPVVQARDGQEAMETYQQQHKRILAVILDYSLPGMSGLDLAEQFRAIDPQVGLIISTGMGDAAVADLVVDRKVDATLAKPYRGEALVQTIQSLEIALKS